MNIEEALNAANPGELSDAELLDLAAAVAEYRTRILDAYRVYEWEIGQRLAATDAKVMRAGAVTVERKVTRSYSWDVAKLEQLAPDFLEYVPERVVASTWRVRSVVGLNNYIDKLGNAPTGEALRAARTIEEKPAPLVFTRQMSEDELIGQLAESARGTTRTQQLIDQLEGVS